jgi:hypothetical protein
MFFLVLSALTELVRAGAYISRGDFSPLHERVRNSLVRTNCRQSCETICRAMDMACIWYWKQARCLQRSAATTCLLRRYGTPAQMVIGTQRMPFKAHTWVEVEGKVVNDKPYVKDAYMVLDRC